MDTWCCSGAWTADVDRLVESQSTEPGQVGCRGGRVPEAAQVACATGFGSAVIRGTSGCARILRRMIHYCVH